MTRSAELLPFEDAAVEVETNEDNEESVWALEDASFEGQQDEVLGIIGRNGSEVNAASVLRR